MRSYPGLTHACIILARILFLNPVHSFVHEKEGILRSEAFGPQDLYKFEVKDIKLIKTTLSSEAFNIISVIEASLDVTSYDSLKINSS
jgi:hypothetical protein